MGDSFVGWSVLLDGSRQQIAETEFHSASKEWTYKLQGYLFDLTPVLLLCP